MTTRPRTVRLARLWMLLLVLVTFGQALGHASKAPWHPATVTATSGQVALALQLGAVHHGAHAPGHPAQAVDGAVAVPAAVEAEDSPACPASTCAALCAALPTARVAAPGVAVVQTCMPSPQVMQPGRSVAPDLRPPIA